MLVQKLFIKTQNLEQGFIVQRRDSQGQSPSMATGCRLYKAYASFANAKLGHVVKNKDVFHNVLFLLVGVLGEAVFSLPA